MPTKKQRRRSQKARRHEYEYVYVDDEGNEVEVDPEELRAARDDRRDPKPQRAGGRSARTSTRKGVEPPSWRRATRRAAIFGPLLVVALMLFNHNLPLTQQVAPAIFLLAFFIPFSYFTDSVAYRLYRRRVERQQSAKSR
jgi:hypothetical protein